MMNFEIHDTAWYRKKTRQLKRATDEMRYERYKREAVRRGAKPKSLKKTLIKYGSKFFIFAIKQLVFQGRTLLESLNIYQHEKH